MRVLDLKRLRLVGLITIMVLVISACSGVFPTTQPDQAAPAPSFENKGADESVEMPAGDEDSEEVVAVVATPEPEQADFSPTPEETVAEMPQQEIAPTDVPTEEVKQEAQVVVKDQIVATDPGTVSLASGQVQLVEFFAYW